MMIKLSLKVFMQLAWIILKESIRHPFEQTFIIFKDGEITISHEAAKYATRQDDEDE